MLVLDHCLRPRRKDGARGAPQKLEQVLANPRGVEILIDQTAAEEEQLPDLDSAGVGSRAGRNLNRSRRKGNGLVGRAASTDDRAAVQINARVEHVVTS